MVGFILNFFLLLISSHDTKGIFERGYLIFLLFVFLYMNISIIGQEKVKRQEDIQIIKPSRLYKIKVKLTVSKVVLIKKPARKGARCLRIQILKVIVAFGQRQQAG